MIRLKIMAVRRPFTEKPGTMALIRRIMMPFMTNIKRPRVTMVKGRVKKTRIGLITALAIPRTTATIKAVR